MAGRSARYLREPAWRVSAKLALRSLRLNVRRTILTAAAMILGGGLLIFGFSLTDGGQEMWIREAARMGTGHIVIERPEFRNAPRIENRLPREVREVVTRALASPAVASRVMAASAQLGVSGLASSAAGARPVKITAVVPETEAGLSTLDKKMTSGRYLRPDDEARAVIGARLAASLRLEPGSKFVVQSEDATGEIASQLLRVAGIFRSGVAEVDQTTVQVPLRTADDWLGAGNGVTNVKVVLLHSSMVPETMDALEGVLAAHIQEGSVAVLDWETANPALASAIALDNFSASIVRVLLFGIIAFGIMNTVLMSVLHRHREFGILQAIGMSPAQTGVIVLIEGMVLTLLSGFIGVGLGTILTWYFFGDGLDFSGSMDEMTFSGILLEPVIVPEFRPGRYLQSLGFILVVGTIASVYPALRAAKIDITEVLKFDR